MKSKKLLAILFVVLSSSITTFSQNINVQLRSHLAYPGQTCSNICGYVDSLNNEYALVGAASGMSIVDVTNLAAPVEVIQIPGLSSKWREIKVRGKYAYVTTEAGGGLQIINLRSLPNTANITYHNWTGDAAIAGLLTSIHALHIDKNFVYLYGSKLFNGGAVVADLTDPWNPTYVGEYSVGTGNTAYIHDGYVRNDTLYGGHIYAGYFSVVDFRDKANPIELANQYTPNKFTHNTWLTKNSKVLFTTDEVNNSYLTSYDISNLSNITELDRIQSNPGSGSIVHNVHIINVAGNDYAVTSWYKDGFTIVDAGRPNNLIQVGNYDTDPTETGGGFNGDWGVYPFLPLGTIVVSNINEGLYVFSPKYVRACYLEGVVTDSTCGILLNNTYIKVTAANINDSTDIVGQYRTGTETPGTYNVTFSKSGYKSKTISGIVLSRGNVNALNVKLVPINTANVNGLASDAISSAPISGALVSISNAASSYNFVTDGSGIFSSCNIVKATDYNVYVGKWGYKTYCASNQTINTTNNNLAYQLTKGYYDDFALNFGWTVSGDATTGAWERGVPLGTNNGGVPANPGVDDSTDCSNIAYVTGNLGVTASDYDVDNGATTLISPVFDLSSYTDPYLDYTRWFYNGGGSGSPNDSLTIIITNGTQNKTVEIVLDNTPNNSKWVHKSFKISSYLAPSANMRLFVRTADASPGHIVEAGFDKFLINEGPTGIAEQIQSKSSISIYPNPFTDEATIAYELKSKLMSNASIQITDVTGRVVNTITLTQTKGTITLGPSINVGIYFVKMICGNEITEPVKVIKMK